MTASPDGSALLRIAPGKPGEGTPAAIATVLEYDPNSGDYRKIIDFPLRNAWAPHAAVITNGAQFIVTFDDWGQLGRTENTVVLYRGTGEFVRAWKLSGIFSEEERKRFVESASSTWWRGDVELLESEFQSPVVIIRPETPIISDREERRVAPTIWFDVVKRRFEKR